MRLLTYQIPAFSEYQMKLMEESSSTRELHYLSNCFRAINQYYAEPNISLPISRRVRVTPVLSN